MTPDSLDGLLDRSAPATRATDDTALTAMVTDARREVPRRRKRRGAVLTAALALALVGTAGVATATDGFTWSPWLEDPVGAISFTMSNGFDCELRFSGYSGGPDPFFVADVNRKLEDWYRSTDVVGEARPLVPQRLRDHRALRSAEDEAELQRQLDELSMVEREAAVAHNSFSEEWIAWTLVVSDLEADALREAGIAVPDPRFVGTEAGSQIQCYDEVGDVYDFGAGS